MCVLVPLSALRALPILATDAHVITDQAGGSLPCRLVCQPTLIWVY
jgi:hypothetical protein